MITLRRNQKGFTLVELAIVLIIIGVIIGGILKGQGMIKNAKIRRVKTDIDGIVAAVYSYQDKYGFLPGDDPNRRDGATRLNATGCTGGNGDGLFNQAIEYPCAWQEIIGAGFVAGDPTQHNENLVAKTSPFGGHYYFRYNGTLGKNYVFVDNIPYDVARSLDEKYDDGVWNRGDVRASSRYTTHSLKDMYWYVF